MSWFRSVHCAPRSEDRSRRKDKRQPNKLAWSESLSNKGLLKKHKTEMVPRRMMLTTKTTPNPNLRLLGHGRYPSACSLMLFVRVRSLPESQFLLPRQHALQPVLLLLPKSHHDPQHPRKKRRKRRRRLPHPHQSHSQSPNRSRLQLSRPLHQHAHRLPPFPLWRHPSVQHNLTKTVKARMERTSSLTTAILPSARSAAADSQRTGDDPCNRGI